MLKVFGARVRAVHRYYHATLWTSCPRWRLIASGCKFWAKVILEGFRFWKRVGGWMTWTLNAGDDAVHSNERIIVLGHYYT